VGGNLNLKLYAIKKGHQEFNNSVQLIVVDLDKSKNYPLNFVCILPQYFRLLEKRSSSFAKIFGEKSLSVAKKLLVEARPEEKDPEIQKVINKRLKDLDSNRMLQRIG